MSPAKIFVNGVLIVVTNQAIRMNLHTVIMKIWARVKEGEVSSPFQRGGVFFLEIGGC